MPGNSSSGLRDVSDAGLIVEMDADMDSFWMRRSTKAFEPAMFSSLASKAANMMFLSGPVLVFLIVPNMSARFSRTVTPEALSSAPL